jgi:Protein of unknown function (DUF2490)
MNSPKYFFWLLLIFYTQYSFAQNTRINNSNNIGWFNYFGTIKLNKNIGIHTEFQCRRADFLPLKQQNIIRLGVNYQSNSKLQFRLGYARAETFAYGEIPLNGFGKDFTEHRVYEMATLNDKISIVEISHRFILEQRWVGRYSNANLTEEDLFPFSNRIRYMCKVQVPLKGNTIGVKIPYASIYNEIFIGFGENVGENIFDQNRLGILVGYKINNTIKLEAGYINQIIQLGREINSFNVIQTNTGLIVNTIFNF